MFEKLVKQCYELIDLPTGQIKHFSFILRRNKIVSLGWNYARKTHPLAAQFKYPYQTIHSELAAIISSPLDWREMSRCKLVNIRVSKMNGGCLRMAKPCKFCMGLLAVYQPKEIFYSTNEGGFAKL